MIKSIAVACIVCITISCNNNSTSSSSTEDSTTDADHTVLNNNNSNHTDTAASGKTDTSNTVVLDDWEIDKVTFDRMVANFPKCPFDSRKECNISDHKKYHVAVDYLNKKYSKLYYNWKYVKARFDDTDVPRYKHNRPRKDPENENVGGHATWLLYVYPNSKNLVQGEHYFDFCIICPPPNTGTCDDLDDPIPLTKGN